MPRLYAGDFLLLASANLYFYAVHGMRAPSSVVASICSATLLAFLNDLEWTKLYTLACYASFFVTSTLPATFRHRKRLFKDLSFDSWWRYCFYGGSQACWNNVAQTQPGARIRVARARFEDGDLLKMAPPLRYESCLNTGSYNYLGWAETGIDCSLAVCGVPGGGRANTLDVLEKPPDERWRKRLQHLAEAAIAQHLGLESAVCFPTGYGCNYVGLPALIAEMQGKGSVLVLSDSNNHASIIRGIQAAINRFVAVFAHNDVRALDAAFKKKHKEVTENGDRVGAVLLVFEGIYSMDGTICDLVAFLEWARRTREETGLAVYTYCDQAHSWGALGATGRGVCEHEGIRADSIDFTMVTLSKYPCAVGGALVTHSKYSPWIDRIRARIQRDHHTAFSTSLNAAECSLKTLRVIHFALTRPNGQRLRCAVLARNTTLLRDKLKAAGFSVMGHPDSPVVPVVIHNPQLLMPFSDACLQRQVAVVVVCYPATPITEPRARFCVSSAHTREDILKVVAAVVDAADEVGMRRFMRGAAACEQSLATSFSVSELRDLGGHPAPCVAAPDNLDVLTDSGKQEGLPNTSLTPHDREVVRNWLRAGVGCAGPRGFFGTMSVHLELEKALAEHVGCPASILYPGAAMLVSGVLPAITPALERTAVALVSESCATRDVRFAVQLTGARFRLFDGQCAADHLEDDEQLAFAVTSITDSPVAQRPWYVVCGTQLAIPESHRGADGFFFTFEKPPFNLLGAAYAGTEQDVDAQRLKGSGYTFSAAVPAFICARILGFLRPTPLGTVH